MAVEPLAKACLLTFLKIEGAHFDRAAQVFLQCVCGLAQGLLHLTPAVFQLLSDDAHG